MIYFKWGIFHIEFLCYNNGNKENTLCCCYDSGEGVTKDYTKAEKWYKKAMENKYVKDNAKKALERLNKKKANG